MMEDYNRTLELTQIAEESAGTGSEQLARSQQSLSTSLNKLKSSWQEFTTGLMDGQDFKGIIDAANNLVQWLNRGATTWKTIGLIITGVIAKNVTLLALDKARLAITTAMAGREGKISFEEAKQLITQGNIATSLLGRIGAGKTLLKLEQKQKKTQAERLRDNLLELGYNGEEIQFLTEKIGLSELLEASERELKKDAAERLGIETQISKEKWEQLEAGWANVGHPKDRAAGLFSKSSRAVRNVNRDLTPMAGEAGEVLTESETAAGAGLLSGIGSAITSALPVILPILAAAALAALIASPWIKDALEKAQFEKQLTTATEGLQKATEKYRDSVSQASKATSTFTKYQELERKGAALTNEELEEKAQLEQELAQELPAVVKYYDEEGNAVLKDLDAVQQLVDAKKEQVSIQRELLAQQKITAGKYGIYDETTSAGQSLKTLTELSANIDTSAMQDQFAGFGLSKNQIKEGLEELQNAGSWNKLVLGNITGDTVNAEQWDRIGSILAEKMEGMDFQEWYEHAISTENGLGLSPEEAQNKLNEYLRLALESTNEFNSHSIDLLMSINEQTANSVISTFANAGDYVKEIAIQEATLNAQKVFNESKQDTEHLENAVERLINQNIDSLYKFSGSSQYFTASLNTNENKLVDPKKDQLWPIQQQGESPYYTNTRNYAKQTNIPTPSSQGLVLNSEIMDERINNLVESWKDSDTGEIQWNLYKKESEETRETIRSLLNVQNDEAALNKLQTEGYKDTEQIITKFLQTNQNKLGQANVLADNIQRQVDFGTLDDSGLFKKWSDTFKGELSEDFYQVLVQSAQDARQNAIKAIGKMKDDGQISADAEDTFKRLGTAEMEAFTTMSSKVQEVVGLEGLSNFADLLAKAISSNPKNKEQIIQATQELLDATTVEGIEKAQRQLSKLGVDAEQLSDAAGKFDEIGYTDLADAEERLKSSTEKLEKSMKALNSAIEGTLDLEGLISLLDTFKDSLSPKDFVVTGQGFKLTEAGKTTTDWRKRINELSAETQRATLLQEQQSTYNTLESTLGKTENAEDIHHKLQKMARGEGGSIEDIYKLAGFENKKQYASEREQIDKLYEQYQEKEKAIYLDRLAHTKLLAEQEVETAKKAKELADALVSLVESFDKYYNIDQLKNVLGLQASDYDAVRKGGFNTRITKQATLDSLNNINQQAVAAKTEYNLAQRDENYWRGQIAGKYSRYLSIGTDGNLQKNQAYYNLANKVQDGTATKEETDELNNLNKTIDNVVEQYTKAYDRRLKAHTDYIKKVQEEKAIIKEQYKYIADMENKIRDILVKNDEKELNNYKKVVEEKKQALQDHLSAVQDAINKERSMRDLADKEEELRQKERKLSILEMDTSGMYAGDIASLQKDIGKDRRNLQDTYVDNYLNEEKERIDKLAEEYDNDISAWESYLEWKKEDMRIYQEEIDDILQQSVDNQKAWYEANSEEFKTATTYNKALMKEEFEEIALIGKSAFELIQEGGLKPFENALQTLKDESIKNVDDAMQQFANRSIVKIDGGKSSMTSAISNMTTKLQSNVDIINIDLTKAWANAQTALQNYNKILNKTYDLIKAIEDTNFVASSQQNKGKDNPSPPTSQSQTLQSAGKWARAGGGNSKGKWQGLVGQRYQSKKITKDIDFNASRIYYDPEDKLWYGKDVDTNYYQVTTYTSVKELLGDENAPSSNPKKAVLFDYINGQWIKQYKTGGYVDYTGPAWVDGTPTKPEAFLNADDTKRFEALRNTLQQIYTGSPTPATTTNKIGDTIYQIQITVESLGDDYTIDDLTEEIENKLYELNSNNRVTRV